MRLKIFLKEQLSREGENLSIRHGPRGHISGPTLYGLGIDPICSILTRAKEARSRELEARSEEA
jgi:hypothetical protein